MKCNFLRVKARMADNLAEAGIRTTGDEIHAHLIALLENVLHCGPGIVASDAAPVYEAHPTLARAYRPSGDCPIPDQGSRPARCLRSTFGRLIRNDRLDRDAEEYYEAQAE